MAGVQFKKLGTDIDLQIVVESKTQEEKAKKDINEAVGLYDKYEKIFSRFDNQSELSKLNKNLNIFQVASAEVLEIAKKCLLHNKKTKNFFDPRIIENLEIAGYAKDFKKNDFSVEVENEKFNFRKPGKILENDLKIRENEIFFGSRMDFSGIAKGWITDKVAEFLLGRGWKNFLVDSGGDMYFSGKNEKNEFWEIDVEGIAKDKIFFKLCNQGVATSGIGKRKWEKGGKRMHHIINPNNPAVFSFNLQSVTVIGDSVEGADVLAKSLFLMSIEDGMKFSNDNSIKSLFLEYNGNARVSLEMRKFLNL